MPFLFGVNLSAEQIHDRKVERYVKAKQGLNNSDHYSAWLKKELKRIVDEFEKEHSNRKMV